MDVLPAVTVQSYDVLVEVVIDVPAGRYIRYVCYLASPNTGESTDPRCISSHLVVLRIATSFLILVFTLRNDKRGLLLQNDTEIFLTGYVPSKVVGTLETYASLGFGTCRKNLRNSRATRLSHSILNTTAIILENRTSRRHLSGRSETESLPLLRVLMLCTHARAQQQRASCQWALNPLVAPVAASQGDPEKHAVLCAFFRSHLQPQHQSPAINSLRHMLDCALYLRLLMIDDIGQRSPSSTAVVMDTVAVSLISRKHPGVIRYEGLSRNPRPATCQV
jgi:hypothetical protein